MKFHDFLHDRTKTSEITTQIITVRTIFFQLYRTYADMLFYQTQLFYMLEPTIYNLGQKYWYKRQILQGNSIS